MTSVQDRHSHQELIAAMRNAGVGVAIVFFCVVIRAATALSTGRGENDEQHGLDTLGSLAATARP
jgi:hypothetical protein